MAGGLLTLLAGLWTGLVRLGWELPAPRVDWPSLHGPLLLSGFLGTLIGLERAVGIRKKWAYVFPVLNLAGVITLVGGAPPVFPAAFSVAASGGLVLVMLFIFKRQPGLHTGVMVAGAAHWLLGCVLWLHGAPLAEAIHAWILFLVFTIAGERLELSRFGGASTARSWLRNVLFTLLAVFLIAAAGISHHLFNLGSRLLGAGFVGLALWLFRYDLARKTIQQTGLPRFTATCILSGYPWLALGGLLLVLYGDVPAGLSHDAILHSILLGFVFSMIFGHAPIMFPAVTGKAMPYSPRFYAHFALLHLSLLLRVFADLSTWPHLRYYAGLINALAILLFLANNILSVREGSAKTQPV